MNEETIEEKVVDVGTTPQASSLSPEIAQRLLDLETRVLGLEAKLSVIEKESVKSSPAIDTKPKVNIYGSNRSRK